MVLVVWLSLFNAYSELASLVFLKICTTRRPSNNFLSLFNSTPLLLKMGQIKKNVA